METEKLARRIDRLKKFTELIAGDASLEKTSLLMREAVMILTAVADCYPETLQTFEDMKPWMYEHLYGIGRN